MKTTFFWTHLQEIPITTNLEMESEKIQFITDTKHKYQPLRKNLIKNAASYI